MEGHVVERDIDPDIHDTLYPPTYFKVIHKAGLRVREAPLQAFDPESQVIPVDTVIYGQRVGDYVQLLDCHDLDIYWQIGHWVTYQARGIQGLEVCHSGSIDVGRWYYRITCKRGMQFLSQPRLDAVRNDRIHEPGSVVVAIKKYVPPGSIMIFCELENNLGHVIEDFSGALLEQLDGEVALEAVSPEERDIGLVHFVVVYRGGLVLRSRPDLEESCIITSTPRKRGGGYISNDSDSGDSLSSISEPGSGKRISSKDDIFNRSDSNDSVNSFVSKSSGSSEDMDNKSKSSVASAPSTLLGEARVNSESSRQERGEIVTGDGLHSNDIEVPKRRASFPSRYSSINNASLEESRRRSSFKHQGHRHQRVSRVSSRSLKSPLAPPITTTNTLPSPDPSPVLPPSPSSNQTPSDNFDQSNRRRRPKQLTIAKRDLSKESESPRTPQTPQTPQSEYSTNHGRVNRRTHHVKRSARRKSRKSSPSSFRPGVIPCGAMIEGCEVLKPAGVDATFVKLSDGRGWVCAVRGRLLAAQAVSPPNVKEGEFWFQVTSFEPIEVVEKPNPLAYATGRRMGLGMVFVSHCIVCPAGGKEGVAYAEVDSEEVSGWVAFIAQQQSGGSALLIKDTKKGDRDGEEYISPLRSVAPPVWEEDAGLYQMLDCNGTLANLNPHPTSSFVGEVIPPYAIVRVDGTLTITPLSASAQSPKLPKSSTTLDSTQGVTSSHKTTLNKQTKSDTDSAQNSKLETQTKVESSSHSNNIDSELNPDDDGGTLVLQNANSRDESNVFLKLSGRPGWVPLSRKDVVRVQSTPTVERGEFIYKVANQKELFEGNSNSQFNTTTMSEGEKEGEGDEEEFNRSYKGSVMVLHGPVLSADHINISLPTGTMVRGRVRLKPYHGMQSVVDKQIEKKTLNLKDQIQEKIDLNSETASKTSNEVDKKQSNIRGNISSVNKQDSKKRDNGLVFIGGHFGEENTPGWVVVSDNDNVYLELVSEVIESIAYGKTLSEYTEMYERKPESSGEGIDHEEGHYGNREDDEDDEEYEIEYEEDLDARPREQDLEDDGYDHEMNNEYDDDKKCSIA